MGVHIPEFLERLGRGRPRGAAEILRGDNALPATTGRVCPQERQCEALCVRGKRGEAVAIGWLERFVADWAAGELAPDAPPAATERASSVAVVGSGPGGLTAAGELARGATACTSSRPCTPPGGVLRYGIPEFRLPEAHRGQRGREPAQRSA